MTRRCDICAARLVRNDSEGICTLCWREGLVFAMAWIGDLRAAGLDAGDVAEIIGAPPVLVADLLDHHVAQVSRSEAAVQIAQSAPARGAQVIEDDGQATVELLEQLDGGDVGGEGSLELEASRRFDQRTQLTVGGHLGVGRVHGHIIGGGAAGS